ncbi:uncharacterized protein L969DRAFT_51941 [Mixia osmundae IAM 14324]|uniref:C4-dicarboxylate transporter/malic acid transport protein n=1 Tax=Mixia osmundae (strain CBS 9802 / IAM 14324 / JCM 22182 / KY 12970) TaxID=764103 RepID=G7E0Q4_MIXOS|nr:uncharacterized protein L969DRAFT_51941 [Mixia osmundae IAM 14324]KEI37890.1 hypothetical protein L969DRAFT_51941 [Mixia osmundae IAM 14324]GAA96414.1 hypothetical protein E5Q_03081 [Mixia osmundae IAM 14324]
MRFRRQVSDHPMLVSDTSDNATHPPSSDSTIAEHISEDEVADSPLAGQAEVEPKRQDDPALAHGDDIVPETRGANGLSRAETSPGRPQRRLSTMSTRSRLSATIEINKVLLKDRIMRFTASWFTVIMGTSIINSLAYLLPWTSTHAGLRVFGLCFLIASSFLFIVFSILTIARYILFKGIFLVALRHEVHALFFGAIPMALATIAVGIALQGDGCGLPGAIDAGAGLWWSSFLLAAATATVVPWVMFTEHNHSEVALTATWLLPVVPLQTVGSAGADIAELLASRRPGYAFTILISSYIANGVGLLLCLFILTLYFQRLVLHHLPGREVIVSTFLPLSPCGQGAAALINLGRISTTIFPEMARRHPDSQYLALLAQTALPLYGAGLAFGLMLWGLGIWWLALAVVSVSRSYWKRDVVFNMGWWAFTFPCGSLCLATLAIAESLDSIFFRVIATMLAFLVLFTWLLVAVPTSYGWATGSVFISPSLDHLPPILPVRISANSRKRHRALRHARLRGHKG